MKHSVSILSGVIYLSLVMLGVFNSPSFVMAEEQDIFILSAGEWNVPRTTETILAMPALQKSVQAYNKKTDARIQIRYPGGDEGTLWAHELRSWYVSLGIASQHIELLPGSRDPGQLEITVVSTPGYQRAVK